MPKHPFPEIAHAVIAEPTLAQVDSACMSYRHDFWLMAEAERELLRFEAKWWLHAWCKEFDAPEPGAAA